MRAVRDWLSTWQSEPIELLSVSESPPFDYHCIIARRATQENNMATVIKWVLSLIVMETGGETDPTLEVHPNATATFRQKTLVKHGQHGSSSRREVAACSERSGYLTFYQIKVLMEDAAAYNSVRRGVHEAIKSKAKTCSMRTVFEGGILKRGWGLMM